MTNIMNTTLASSSMQSNSKQDQLKKDLSRIYAALLLSLSSFSLPLGQESISLSRALTLLLK